MAGRLMKIGCRGSDIEVCLLKVLLRGGPEWRFAPVGRDKFNIQVRGDIVSLLNTKTGLDLSVDDAEVLLAINRTCIKLMKKGLLRCEKVIQDKVLDSDATIWNVFWIDAEVAKGLTHHAGHRLVSPPDLRLMVNSARAHGE